MIDAVRRIAEEAVRSLLERFGRLTSGEITRRGRRDVVTAADRESEALIRRRLAAAFPDVEILGEEEGGPGRDAERLFVVDPLDGTVNFVQGIPMFAVSIGYVGTRTDGQYASRNANYAESGGNGARQLFAQAGTASINIFASSAKTRYHALQMAVNRPFKNGFMIKGAYTLSKSMNEVEDDGGGYTWQDRLEGTLTRSWRLDVAPPARLERVSVGPEDQVITRRPGSDRTGIEVRQGKVLLTAEGRLPGRSSLPAVGWDHDFQEVTGELQGSAAQGNGPGQLVEEVTAVDGAELVLQRDLQAIRHEASDSSDVL